MAILNSFRVDGLYSSEEIQAALRVGNAGGVRVAIGDDESVSRIVVMSSVSSNRQVRENPYHDRIEGDILVYTGAEREGDQSLSGVNKRLPPTPHPPRVTIQPFAARPRNPPADVRHHAPFQRGNAPTADERLT